jgi:hypothetical protein
MKRSIVAAMVLTAGLAIAPSARSVGVTVAVTADTEGHVNPCAECPHGAGDGGLARRATAIAALRGPGPLLLVDAGNALFGPDSLDSGGAVIAEAYDRLAYDAVNLSYRDFRLGKDATLALLKRAKFQAVSANLLDIASHEPIVKPYVIKAAAGRRVAVIGVTEVPAGMDYLPHLKRQLAGVTIVPPAEALAQWLPKAKAEADDVVLLYYGSAAGAKKVADAFGKDLAAILVGGARPEEMPASTGQPPLTRAEQHGKSIARLTLGEARAPEQIAINDSVAADPAMAALLAKAGPAPTRDDPATAAVGPKPDAGAGEPAEPGARTLVQVEVKPLEPEPAPTAEQVAPEAASAGKQAPATQADTAPELAPGTAPDRPADTKSAGGTGVLGFLKSLVSGSKTGTAAAGKQPPPSNASAPADEPVVNRASPTPAAEPAGETAGETATEPAAPPQQSAGQPQRAPASSGPKFCTNCGAKLQPNAKFCTKCGVRVKR